MRRRLVEGGAGGIPKRLAVGGCARILARPAYVRSWELAGGGRLLRESGVSGTVQWRKGRSV
eukprot:4589109-Pyramimonas_sp.AAC.1